ncbi:uncharacterized protein LOC100210680 [Hydra vulgaris]|uniref:uncharacterized protein LOC100210680 n=1 Tax=Hydra vulgaris TaxID=6087 RepID=UPI0001926C04|nr:uncharacterized protein LOC100210680 [Hydra vulgaris]
MSKSKYNLDTSSGRMLIEDQDNIISQLSKNSNHALSSLASRNLMSRQGQIIITDEGIVFPPGALMVDANHVSDTSSLVDGLTDDTQNDNDFDIKVESIKVESSQSNTSFSGHQDVLQSIHSEIQNLNFSSNGTQFHFMPLSSDDIENLQKINRNVLMSQAALPEENKCNESIIEQDTKNLFLAQSSHNGTTIHNEKNQYLERYSNEDATGLFIKHERAAGSVINRVDDISTNKLPTTPTDLEILDESNAYQHIVYIQLDGNNESQLIPATGSSQLPLNTNKIVKEKMKKENKKRTHKINTSTKNDIEKVSLRTLAPRMPLHTNTQLGMNSERSHLKPMTFTSQMQLYEGGEHFEVLGRCIQCFRFSRTTAYCRAEKNHRDPKSSVCLECEATGVSTVVCRRKMNHTAPNALPLNIVINTALQQPDYVRQLCLRNNLPYCLSELQSIVLHHADITFSAVRLNNEQNDTIVARKPSDYARGYLYPYSQEKWEDWLDRYCQQTNTSYRIRTGKRRNKKMEHGLANHNGKIVQYRTLETQLYNCALGGKPRKRKLREGIKRRKERGSKLIGCSAVIHTRLLETENEWRALEITVPKLSAHLNSHDPRMIQKNNLIFDFKLLPQFPQQVIIDEQHMIDFSQIINEDYDFTLKKKEVPLPELKKCAKNLLLMCASLLDQINDVEAINTVQEHGQIILNRLLKDSVVKPPTPKKKRRCKDVNAVDLT